MRCDSFRVSFVLAALTMTTSATESQTLTTRDILNLPTPEADYRIHYGENPLQFGDLRLPKEKGPHPVAVVVHGGCWLAEYNLDHISSFCDALTRAGIATWSLEYRRIGDEGGGWPGTFDDVARGSDYLRELAENYPLNLERVIAVGHSAGGHLALWLGARARLPRSSELFSENPIALCGIVSLAGVVDLRRAHEEEICGDSVKRLIGGGPDTMSDRYRQASPMELLPLGVPHRLVQGARDEIVPLSSVEAYLEAGRRTGDDVELIVRKEAGHFELIAPTTAAWRVVRDTLINLLNRD
jgi:acetyl esterase/lipase